jgi:hypothetical protein
MERKAEEMQSECSLLGQFRAELLQRGKFPMKNSFSRSRFPGSNFARLLSLKFAF